MAHFLSCGVMTLLFVTLGTAYAKDCSVSRTFQITQVQSLSGVLEDPAEADVIRNRTGTHFGETGRSSCQDEQSRNVRIWENTFGEIQNPPSTWGKFVLRSRGTVQSGTVHSQTQVKTNQQTWSRFTDPITVLAHLKSCPSDVRIVDANMRLQHLRPRQVYLRGLCA